jgi:hypothetical protein
MFPGLLSILMILYLSIPIQFPRSCSVRVSLSAIRAAATGGWPRMPPGAWIWFSPVRTFYGWDEYCHLLRYLREHTGPETIVANVLKNPPFPPANGAIGRRSPFRVESGVAWMWVVSEDLDEEFARDLEGLTSDSVVVWATEEIENQPRLPLRRLTKVIMDRYAPEARFGKFEVWRRRPG